MKKVLLVLVVLVVALVVVIATRPDSYRVERSTTIDAPAATIFAEVEDLRAWGAWSPWEKRDPAMKKTFSAATAGVGASYAWEGNKEVGKGKMTVIALRPTDHVAHRLEFLEPFPSTAETAFDLKPEGPEKTRVTWSMSGKNNFIGKAFALVMDMDKMIGKDFEDGLASLKRTAEAKKPPPAPPAEAAATADKPSEPAPAPPAAAKPTGKK